MKKINSENGDLIAIIVRKDFGKKDINFISEENFPLQLGINRYDKGAKIKPHYHLKRKIEIENTQEIVHIQEGKVKVDLYDLNNDKFQTMNLYAGDTIFFIEGGHGFEILDDTKVIEVKQGPYIGKDKDKKVIK